MTSDAFPLEIFTELMSSHLESFKTLESLQLAALKGMQNQGLEDLAGLLTRQQAVYIDIARQMAELKPYLNQWEALRAEERQRLRQGRPGEILDALEQVAKSIQARHAEMFGADAEAGKQGGGQEKGGGDLSQMINLYRGMQ